MLKKVDNCQNKTVEALSLEQLLADVFAYTLPEPTPWYTPTVCGAVIKDASCHYFWNLHVYLVKQTPLIASWIFVAYAVRIQCYVFIYLCSVHLYHLSSLAIFNRTFDVNAKHSIIFYLFPLWSSWVPF